MTFRTVLVILLALVSGISAAYGFYAYALNNKQPAAALETEPVVVANGPLTRGSMVAANQVKLWDCPKGAVPAGALTRVEDAIGRAVLNEFVTNEVILDKKLAAKGDGGGLAVMIPPGMRAFTITTPNLAAGVAGFAMPKNKVDVLLTHTPQGQNDPTGGGTTTTLLQNVEILAVDHRLDAPADNRVDPKELRSVTLLVTPAQAAKLDLGQNKGTLHLSLRNMNDNSAATTRPETLIGLRGYEEKPWDLRLKEVFDHAAKKLSEQATKEPAKPAAFPAPPPQRLITTIRGGQPGKVLVELPAAPGQGVASARPPGAE